MTKRQRGTLWQAYKVIIDKLSDYEPLFSGNRIHPDDILIAKMVLQYHFPDTPFSTRTITEALRVIRRLAAVLPDPPRHAQSLEQSAQATPEHTGFLN